MCWIMSKKPRDYIAEGKAQYQAFRESLVATPELRAIYEEEARKQEFWLQMVEARQKLGLTQTEVAKRLGMSQKQVARIEKRGYDVCTLNTLQRDVEVLGSGYVLKVRVYKPRVSHQHIPKD